MTVTRLSEILIIEDNEDHLALTMEALEDAAVRNPIRAAGSLRQARAYLERRAQHTSQGDEDLPCLILLDVRLPDGLSMEALREIRQHPRLSTTPVVALTSSDHTPDINRAYESGADSYLVKPVSSERFHHMVREAGLYWAVLNGRARPTVGD